MSVVPDADLLFQMGTPISRSRSLGEPAITENRHTHSKFGGLAIAK